MLAVIYCDGQKMNVTCYTSEILWWEEVTIELASPVRYLDRKKVNVCNQLEHMNLDDHYILFLRIKYKHK